ncbi:ABC transporter substrate-binding protein [Membranihabitans marinus]|uniref:ABC transporter substrate-binding protein n=1 Tax=Membranihabitans marinus TaxID=1227546 RepID=UPI001F2A0306|nr:ABC transporter substrate-binding protein [Membranihabitans marinus]
MTILRFVCILFIVFNLFQCKDPVERSTLNVIKIQINSEPDILNPAISRKTVSSQIESQMYLPLAEIDDHTGEWIPILLNQWKVTHNDDGVRYELILNKDAYWSDGKAIDKADLIYTLVMGLNPYAENKAWAAYISLIHHVEDLDGGLAVILKEPYILSDEFIGSLSIYPSHRLDEEGLANIEILNHLLETKELTSVEDQKLESLSSSFNSYGQIGENNYVVNGPYIPLQWMTNQKIVLERREDFWGDDVLPKIYTENKAQRLEFIIIPNEENALNAFIQDEVDVLTDLREKDTSLISDYGGQTMSVPNLQVLYIALNNQNSLLENVGIRRALNYAVNRSDLISKLFNSNTLPVYGPIHPSKYYADTTAVPHNVERAKQMLSDLGCVDRDGDGIVECEIGNKWQPLVFNIWTTRSTLSKNVATLLKSYWLEIGVELNIESADFKSFLPELQQKSFDMAALALRQNNIKDDPYPLWHSSQAIVAGKNYQGLKDDILDSILEDLRTNLNFEEQMALYHKFQKRFSEITPVIFLVAPVDIIGVKNRIDVYRIAQRPGYDIGRSGVKTE